MSALKLTLSLSLFVVAAALVASPANAQTVTTPAMSFPSMNVQVSIGGQNKMQSDRLFINKRQCCGTASPCAGTTTNAGTGDAGTEDAGTEDAGTEDAGTGDAGTPKSRAKPKALGVQDDSTKIQVTVANLSTLPMQPTVLEFWMGMGSQECHTAANRTSTAAAPGNPPCKQVVDPIRTFDTKKAVLNFTAMELFTDRKAYVTDNKLLCGLQGTWTLYIVPLVNATPISGTPEAGIGNPIFVKFEPDFEPLAPVTTVKGGRGETEVTVNWDMASGANNLTSYNIYFDTTAKQSSGSGACTSTLLEQGKDLPLDLEPFETETTRGTSVNVDPASLGLQFNERLPAAVVSVDPAGNESLVSNVVCVERVSTTGFWDACNSDQKCEDGFDKCSLSVVAKSGFGGWLTWSLGALGIALWIRRRRSV